MLITFLVLRGEKEEEEDDDDDDDGGDGDDYDDEEISDRKLTLAYPHQPVQKRSPGELP